jgi:hypothetical protein
MWLPSSKHIYSRSLLILFSHLFVRLHCGPFPWGWAIATKITYAFLVSSVYAAYSAYRILEI